jgi:hypothetical protein
MLLAHGARREALGCALHVQVPREAEQGTSGPSCQAHALARVTAG